MAVAVGAVVIESAEPKLDRLTGLVCMLSPVTPDCSGMTSAFAAFSIGALICDGSAGASLDLLIADWLVPIKLCTTASAGFGLICREMSCCRRRSSSSAAAPVSGWGECRGESPRGDLVRWEPKVALVCEFCEGVFARLGAGKGPECVGVMARVEAAMRWSAYFRM